MNFDKLPSITTKNQIRKFKSRNPDRQINKNIHKNRPAAVATNTVTFV